MTVKFNFEVPAETSSIFTDEANQFVESLHNKFSAKISELLQARASRQEDFNNGKLPDFYHPQEKLDLPIGKLEIFLKNCLIEELK